MVKKKKNPDEWEGFVSKLVSRKRKDRNFIISKDYLLALADKLSKINPSKEITYNTLKDAYSVGYEKGYYRHIMDNKFFKDTQNKHFNDAWNKFSDEIDDMIHDKN